MWRVRIMAARFVLLCAECVHGLYARVHNHFDAQSRGQARTCMAQRMTLLTALGARVVRAQHGGAFLLLCRDYAHGACVRAYLHLHPQLRGQARTCMEQRTTLRRALGVHVVRAQHGGAFLCFCVQNTCTARAHGLATVLTRCCVDKLVWTCTYVQRCSARTKCTRNARNTVARFLVAHARARHVYGARARTRRCSNAQLRVQLCACTYVRLTLLGSHEVHGEREKHGGAC